MRLKDYMALRKLSPTEFAGRIKVSDESVKRYVRGTRRPSPDVMARIAKSTKGMVTANDFYDMPANVREREAAQ